jgi:2-dehydropantoate 2-reductase
LDKQIEVTRPMGPYKPSSLVDYLAGREVEVEAIWGEPARRARAAGSPLPRLEALYAQLKTLTAAKRSSR